MPDLRAVPLVCAVLGIASCVAHTPGFAYSGTVQADAAAVGSTAGGRVTGVLVSDGQRVSQGQVIVRFDDRQQRAAYDAALAQASQAAAALNDLLAGPRQAEIDKAAAAADQAEAAYRQAQLARPQQVAAAQQSVHAAQSDVEAAHGASQTAAHDFERAQKLYDEGAISAQALDAARAVARSAAGAYGASTARLRTSQAALDSFRAGTVAANVQAADRAAAAAQANLALVREGARPDQIAQARAAAQAAAANVAAALARLDETQVKAPASGIVDGLDLHVGDLVAPSAAVATIDEFGDPWVRIYVAQSEMQSIRVGSSVQVRSDALGGRSFSGRIELIDATAQFTPRDVQTASDRADLSFGVKVRIHDPDRALRAGTTVEVALQ